MVVVAAAALSPNCISSERTERKDKDKKKERKKVAGGQ